MILYTFSASTFTFNPHFRNPYAWTCPLSADMWVPLTIVLFSKLKDSIEYVTNIFKAATESGLFFFFLVPIWMETFKTTAPTINTYTQLGSDMEIFRATWGRWKKEFNEHQLCSRLPDGYISLNTHLLPCSPVAERCKGNHFPYVDYKDPNTINFIYLFGATKYLLKCS